MNKINMPGFTAEASLYKTSKCYHTTRIAKALISEYGVMPQLRDGGLLESPLGPPEPRDRWGCFPDSTSSTGWRESLCTTIPGFGTQCWPLDECPAPGCYGPCTCTCTQNCSRTCTQKCFRYGQQTGQRLDYTRPCIPTPPPGSL